MACQQIWGYFMHILYIHIYMVSEDFCKQLYDIKYSYFIQLIPTLLCDIKYFYLIQIICIQFYDINQIQIITDGFDSKIGP